jgi:hypothetical protein
MAPRDDPYRSQRVGLRIWACRDTRKKTGRKHIGHAPADLPLINGDQRCFPRDRDQPHPQADRAGDKGTTTSACSLRRIRRGERDEAAENKHGCPFHPDEGGTYYVRPNAALHEEKSRCAHSRAKVQEAKKNCKIIADRKTREKTSAFSLTCDKRLCNDLR